MNGSCACNNTVENTDLLCSNGIDDNCNTFTDCADNGCNGKQCSNNGGHYCINQKCSQACRIGGVVYAQGAANPMNSCQVCDATKTDGDWTKLDGVACSKGTCHAGACCTGCWDGAACHGASASFCGAMGGACVDCNNGNPCQVPSCAAGACMLTNVADGTVCAAPNACGTGGMCANGCSNCTLAPSCMGGMCNGAPVQKMCCPLLYGCSPDGMGGTYCKFLG
jgi:hypothetical protein